MNLKKIENRFEEQLESVDELIAFDKLILDFCIGHIESLNERLKNGPFSIENPSYLAENTLKAIKNIRENNSFQKHYQSIYNSCLVLQVSYFTSSINDIFKYTFHTLTTTNQLPDVQEDVAFSINDLKILTSNPESNLGDLLFRKKDISLDSIDVTIDIFKKYFGVIIKQDSQCNTITLAQASRNAIVHSLAIADEKFFNQIQDASPRDVKKQIELKDKLQYSKSELEFIKLSMLDFTSDLCGSIRNMYTIN